MSEVRDLVLCSTTMTCDELRRLLHERDVQFTEKPVQNGTRFDCASGETFNVFDSGKMSFQRKQDTQLANDVKALYNGGTAGPTPAKAVEAQGAAVPVARGARPVFIVYGHDLAARDQLELILRRMALEPIVLGNLAAAGDTIIEKLEKYLGEHGNVGVSAAFCLLPTTRDIKPGSRKKRSIEPDRMLYWSLA